MMSKENLFLILMSTCYVATGGDAISGAQDGTAGHGIGQTDENEEVMRALLIHEKRAVAGAGAGAGGASAAARGLASAKANASDSESDTSESDDEAPSGPPPSTAAAVAAQHQADEDDEEEDDDEFEEVGDEPMVMVGGRPFSYREVSQRPELVEQMSAQEKEAYIEMGQNLFQDMYF